MIALIFLGTKDDDGLFRKVAQDAVNVLKDRSKAQQISSEGLSHNDSRDGVNIVGPGDLDNLVLNLIFDLLVIVF